MGISRFVLGMRGANMTRSIPSMRALAALAIVAAARVDRSAAVPARVGARVPTWGCGVGPSPHQSWHYNNSAETFALNDRWAEQGAAPLCLTAESLIDGSFVSVDECGAATAADRQRWAFDIPNATKGRYVTVTSRAAPWLLLSVNYFDMRLFDASGNFGTGTTWWLTQFNATPPVVCSAAERLTHPGSCICACTPEEFKANKCGAPALAGTGSIVNSGSGWCADAGPWDRFPCDPTQPMAQPNITSLPFCDKTKPRSERVKDLVTRVPDSDLFSLLQTGGVSVISLRIPPWNWWNEALHGVSTWVPPTKTTTVFPSPMQTAASMNKSLFHAVGAAESLEARAAYNAGSAFLTDWSPNINIVRDPRWGRAGETPVRVGYVFVSLAQTCRMSYARLANNCVRKTLVIN
jgi:hypothetical protein